MNRFSRHERPVSMLETSAYDVGEVVRYHEVCDFSAKGGTGLEGGVPVRIVVMEGALVMCRAAVVTFEFGGRGLETFDWISYVFTIRSR